MTDEAWSCRWKRLYSLTWPLSLSALPCFGKYVIVPHPLFKPFWNSDSFMLQVHYNPVHHSMHNFGIWMCRQGLWRNVNFRRAGNENGLTNSRITIVLSIFATNNIVRCNAERNKIPQRKNKFTKQKHFPPFTTLLLAWTSSTNIWLPILVRKHFILIAFDYIFSQIDTFVLNNLFSSNGVSLPNM